MLYFQAGADFFTDIYTTVAWQLRKLLNQTSGFSDNTIYKKLRRFQALCLDEGEEKEKSASKWLDEASKIQIKKN